MAKITIELDLNAKTGEALTQLFKVLNAGTPAGTETDQPTDASQLELPDTAEVTEPKKTAKKKAVKDAPKTEEQPPFEPDTAAVTLEDIRPLVIKYSKQGKQSDIKAIFTKYGAERLTEISEDKYAAVKADLEALNG